MHRSASSTSASRFAVVAAPRVELHSDPAVKAWTALQLVNPCGGVTPCRLSVLKDSRTVAIYRLQGAGTDGSNVIAKRYWGSGGSIEQMVYESVLPYLGMATLRYYGTWP